MAEQDRMERGTVEAVNDRGLKINGAWKNWSKFAEVQKPVAGDDVELVVRQDKWVQGCKIIGGSGEMGEHGWDGGGEMVPAGAPADDDPSQWGYGSTGGQAPAAPVPAVSRAPRPAAPMPQAMAMAPAPVAKGGRTSLRAAALAASAHFHSGNPSADEEAVYDTATRFLAWIDDEANV